MFRPLVVCIAVFVALAGLSVAACAREEAAPARATAPAAAEQPAPAATPALTPEESEQAAAASQETTSEATAEERSDASLERLAQMPADQQLPGGKWKAGVNYEPLVPAQPTSVGAGKVEVTEVFWYGCAHCYALEPYLASWQKNKPENVELVKVPVMWGPVHRAHARLYYTLQALDRGDLSTKVFETIHQKGNMLVANDEERSMSLQRDFAIANGIKKEDFDKAYNSFSVNSNLQRAEQLTQRYRVEAVPVVVVNGKYVTDVSRAGGQGPLLQLINDLAAAEKRR